MHNTHHSLHCYRCIISKTHSAVFMSYLVGSVSCRLMLADMCGYIPARSAELSTGNLLNANHAEENLEIINQ